MESLRPEPASCHIWLPARRWSPSWSVGSARLQGAVYEALTVGAGLSTLLWSWESGAAEAGVPTLLGLQELPARQSLGD
jgi:hypothetical protein